MKRSLTLMVFCCMVGTCFSLFSIAAPNHPLFDLTETLSSAEALVTVDCGGCTDATACNFNPAATEDDGTCFYGNCDFYAAMDIVCVNDGEPVIYNVLCNDGLPQGMGFEVQQQGEDNCFYIDAEGNIGQYPDVTDCCGDHFLAYAACNAFGECVYAEVIITVKCGKPDCSLFNLEDYMQEGDIGIPGEGRCLDVCENSVTTLFVPFNPNYTYIWHPTTGGTGVIGGNPAEFIVTWGAAGSGTISLEIIDQANVSTTHDFCVNILDGPVANFTSPGYVCLNSSICFTNLSTNDDAWEWDFGDGNYSSMEHPCHTYTSPGTYTVTLTATKINYDFEGNPLCCCTDVITMDVEVDPLPGPNIYWVSTLCEGDSSKYWTDATNCDSLVWTVQDANGIDIPFVGQGNDTICVTWNIGPVGTISLLASGCDSTYCNNPTTVTVPIIPAISSIQGPIEVCENTTHTYSLPKWLSTYYDWQVTGGTLSSPNGGHSVSITWGPAGVGTIHVDYHSEFLAGLPGHDGVDCYGSADLTVNILPAFDVVNFGSNTVCVGDASTLQAFSSPNPNCNWTITPFVPFTGQNTDILNVTWNVPAGTYVICATPLDTNAYCNDEVCKTIRVVEVPPVDSISGPIEICPGDTTYYTANSSTPGVSFYWSAVNGTPLSITGTTVGIAWNNSGGPYSVSVYQQLNNPPNCASDPITLTVNPKEINGIVDILPGPACTNTIGNYNMTPALQHGDTEITWSVSPAIAGSVLVQGGTSTQVQWNNLEGNATLTVQLVLCGDTVIETETFFVRAPIVPVIQQVGNLCPGVNATLTTTQTFNSYLWSTGSTTQTTTISSAGTYTVTTVDINGCQASASFQANNIPGPTANVTSGDNPTICIPEPHTVTMITPFNTNYSYQWWCNGSPAGTNSASFVHPFQGAQGSYVYYVVVTDTTTGCIETSDTFTVNEVEICDGPPCEAEDHTFDIILAANQFPNCNVVDYNVNLVNGTFNQWTFGDGNLGGSASTSHAYTLAGNYYVTASAFIPAIGGGFCEVKRDTMVTIPVAADFDFAYIGCDTVQFTDFSSYINDDPNNVITGWNWTFGTLGTSSLQNPQFVFTTPGSHTITLTVTTVGGCIATFTDTVFIGSVGAPLINLSPGPYCVGDPIAMNATAFGASSYEWNFGDGATFLGQSPSHTYTANGNYTITVTAYNDEGCSATNTVNIDVYPSVPEGVITSNPGLTICQGQLTVLSAPSGYAYNWSNGATTQSISVGAGTYDVTLTDGNGCQLTLDAVTVVELPPPPAVITGNFVICDAGCVTLNGTSTAGSTYQWLDDNGVPISGATFSTLTVCDFNLLPGYSVQVTDANGCTATSAQVSVILATSPSFSVTVSPNGCEGTLNTLSVTPVDANVNYAWSNGDTGPVTMVSAAGVYTVIGTDVNTGCSHSVSVTIHPLPDLCIVPVGCYEACNPDTICGPPGLAAYQWNLNGVPISGATSECLIVTQSGEYTLTGTTSFGCEDTSESLILELIDCDDPCLDLEMDWSYLVDSDGNLDSCCYVLNYFNPNPGIKSFVIHTGDADFVIDPSTVNPQLSFQGSTSNSVTLADDVPNDSIPTGALNNVITICLENVTSEPQMVIVDWYDMDNQIICMDTMYFTCPVEPDCLYLLNDSIYCEDGQTFYDFTVCNPNDADFPVGYFILNPSSPAGVVVTPDSIDVTGSPILPGTCQSFTVQLSGPNLGGDVFCYQLIAHDQNPDVATDALCCALDSIYCIDIPFCDPCEQVGIEFVESLNEEDCCYSVSLFNAFSPTYFDEIGVCVISPNTTITVNNPPNNEWTTSGYTPTAFSLLPGSFFNNWVPDNGFTLPDICLQTDEAPNQLVEIKWMKDGEVVCRDTLSLFCEPGCGYMLDEVIDCTNTGWNYSACVKNMADYTVSEAHIHFNDPALSAYDQIVSLGSLAPGSVFCPINLSIGAPAMAGDTICFTVTLHELSQDGDYLSCCNFEHCFVLPPCDFEVPCACDDEFYAMVDAGFNYTPSGPPNAYSFSLVNQNYFDPDCDTVIWNWGDGTPNTTTNGAPAAAHTFPSVGVYTVCVRVYRIASDGMECKRQVCMPIDVGPSALRQGIVIFPNPNEGNFKISLGQQNPLPVQISVYDNTQRLVDQRTVQVAEDSMLIDVDLSIERKGLFFVHFRRGDEWVVEKVIVF